MAIVKLISVFLAAATMVTAAPNPSDLSKRADIELFERGLGEMVLFKRDDVLTPRDLELANLHGVNISQMWKHSVMKRSDGDDYTFWVDNSFTTVELPSDDASEETDSAAVEKRQQNIRYYSDFAPFVGPGHACHNFEFRDDTGPSAPFTGGILHMATWAQRNKNGRFEFYSGDKVNRYDYRTLFVAGSNSGGNAVFRASPSMTRRGNGRHLIGGNDIEHIALGVNSKFAKKFGNSYRARAWGPMWCNGMNPNFHEQACHWHITNTDLPSNPFWPPAQA